MKCVAMALPILVVMSLANGSSRVWAQACGSCDGDINGDHQVTVDEILTAVNSALNGCGRISFKEEFLENSLDNSRWRVAMNGYPVPAVSVSDGYLQIGEAGTSALDFPYVASLGTVFPTEGNFQVRIIMQYLAPSAPQGAGVTILGPNNEEVFRIWGGRDALFVTLEGPSTSIPVQVANSGQSACMT